MLMLSKDEFKEFVKRSVIFQRKESPSSMTYVNIDNEGSICPFCREQMKTTKVDECWYLYCICGDAREYSSRINSLLHNITELQNELNKQETIVLNNVLNICKEHYDKVLMPEFWKKWDDEHKEIMNIESLGD